MEVAFELQDDAPAGVDDGAENCGREVCPHEDR